MFAVSRYERTLGIGPEDAEGWDTVRSARRLLAGDGSVDRLGVRLGEITGSAGAPFAE